jgi:predicted secreted Zn-dependent protease
MKNYKEEQTTNTEIPPFWKTLCDDIDDHNAVVDEKTLIEQFVIECGKYGDTAQIPDEVIEQYIRREKRKIEEAKVKAQKMEKQMAIKIYADYENYLEEEFKNQCGGQAVVLSFEEFYERNLRRR